jgi:tetraacyldisaccharide 4'-kinase
MALARALSARGERVALVGHAYRARPGRPRIVTSRDLLRDVGDEALEALSAGVPVVVGPTRQSAVDRAAREARTIVVDGLLQARPAKVARSILVVDAREPWGSGLVLPFGDLRATLADLAAAADVCVALVDPLEQTGSELRLPIPVVAIPTTLDAPAEGRIGLVLAMARPGRVLRALALRGIEPVSVELLADHARPAPRLLDRLAQRNVDVWLTTRKTRPLLPDRVGGAPVRALRFRLELDAHLLDRVYASPGAP